MKEFPVKDGSGRDTKVKGLSGDIKSNMLFTFFRKLITRGQHKLDVDIIVFDGHAPMPANGHKLHEDDIPTQKPFKLDIREYNKATTEGERRATELAVSTRIYAVKQIRDAHNLPFPFFRMGNYMRLDVDIHVAAKDEQSQIEVSDMAHCK